MQAYYEIETTVPSNHQLSLQLPEEIPAGKVKLAIIYELPHQDGSKKTLKSLQTFMANYKDVDVDTGFFDAQRKMATERNIML